MRRGLAAMLLLVMAMPAAAHHIKGLPHFGYKDMGWYPQIPSKETIRRLKHYLVVATTMPGDPKAGSQVNIHLYVKDLKASQPLHATIRYSLSRRRFFFFQDEVAPPTPVTPILELFQIDRIFEEGGHYTLTLLLPDHSSTTVPIEVHP